MRIATDADRRAALVRRHLLDGSGTGPEDVVRALVALHATDPASVVLSVLARSRTATPDDVVGALAERRTLVRWMAMRRTLFVFAREDVPVVQAAVSTPLAAALRRRLAARIVRNGVEPPVPDVDGWLAATGNAAVAALRDAGAATGAELRRAVPALAAVIPPRAASEVAQSITSPLLTVLGTEGRIVRGAPVGAWTTRAQRWEPVEAWWPAGVPDRDPEQARADLAERWLERFGPATVDDLQWWTGWNLGDTRAALARVATEPVEVGGRDGLDLAGRAAPPEPPPPVAALLPALDPTPMGWRDRGWFTPVDREPLYDRAGNIGPTAWWDGEVVGVWASTPTGVRTQLLIDRGRAAAEAVAAAAAELEQRLGGVVVVPAARTPGERRLSA